MPNNARLVARDVRFFADKALSPQALSGYLAQMAKAERDRLISEGRASPIYTTTVDGREGALEETVKPSGVIEYDFSDLVEVIGTMLGRLIGGSPIDTGEFRKSWAMAVNMRPVSGDLSQIPPRSEIMIVNLAPFSRKVETGAMPRMLIGKFGIEVARQYGQRKFPHYSFEKSFVNLPSSFGSLTNFEVPYILRGAQRSFAARHAKKIRANGGRSVVTNRAELTKGELLAYPALIFKRREI